MIPKKRVSIKEFNVGDTFNSCIKSSGSKHFASFKIVKRCKNGYMVSCYNCTPEFFDNDTIIEVSYSEDELLKIYENDIIELFKNVNHKLYDKGDAIHEMWNGWVWDSNPAETVVTLQQEKLMIIGYFELADYQKAGYSDMDIGIVAEDIETGNRIWCHAKKGWYESWRKWFPKLWEKAIKE